MALNPGIIAIAVGILSVLFFLWRKADASLDPDEPPIALSRIPFIGHILGLVRYQIGYFENLRSVAAIYVSVYNLTWTVVLPTLSSPSKSSTLGFTW
jgi:hypothetical protein